MTRHSTCHRDGRERGGTLHDRGIPGPLYRGRLKGTEIRAKASGRMLLQNVVNQRILRSVRSEIRGIAELRLDFIDIEISRILALLSITL